MQVNGTNYIVPIGAPDPLGVVTHMNDEAEHVLADRYISLNELLLAFGAHRRDLSSDLANVLIIDACRDNPFRARSGRRYPRGLAETPETANTLIAFSASPGATADDGPPGSNSPYAVALADAFSQGYLPLELVFNRITTEVLTTTARQQRPDYRIGLSGFYCIVQCSLIAAAEDIGQNTSVAPVNNVGSNLRPCTGCVNEEVIHLTSQKSLWVSKTVIPLSLWKMCIAVLACPEREDREGETEDSAATRISWSEITKFLIWLSNKSGKPYRLPTSDEWTEIHRHGQTSGNSKASAMQIPQNADSGILVDEGVAEWTSSCESQAAGATCLYRIVRGTSWENANDSSPVTVDAFPIDARGSSLGFRVVRDH